MAYMMVSSTNPLGGDGAGSVILLIAAIIAVGIIGLEVISQRKGK